MKVSSPGAAVLFAMCLSVAHAAEQRPYDLRPAQSPLLQLVNVSNVCKSKCTGNFNSCLKNKPRVKCERMKRQCTTKCR